MAPKEEARPAPGEGEIFIQEGQPWTMVTGQLRQINLSAVSGMWQETAIVLDDGEIVILIGEKTDDLKSMMGKKVTVSGALKPRLTYAGKLTRTIYVHEIITEEKTAADRPKIQ